MITVRHAAQKAFEYLNDLVTPEPIDVLVEEIEMDDSKNYWFITVSFLVKNDKLALSPLSALSKLSSEFERKYKTIKVDANNGEFISMKIRELQ